MKGPMKTIVLAVAVLVLVGGAFWGGTAYQSARTPVGPDGAFAAAGDGTMPQGGPMADLTDEERQELENMSDAERQEWFQDNMGDRGAGQGGPMRGGMLEGEVLEVAEGTLTIKVDSGSQTFYTDADTVFAYVEGAGELAAGSTVMVVATPAADGVTTASLVVVQ